MTAFSSLQERDRLKDEVDEGPVWNKEIEPKAMALIDHFEAEHTETTPGFETFSGAETPQGTRY